MPPLRILLLLFLSVTLTACRQAKHDNSKVLTVSIEPLRYVVKAIVDDKYEVNTLMPQGASPETYEPVPRQMMELDGSEMVIRMGTLGFEQAKLPQMVASVPHLTMIDAAQGIPMLADSHHHAHDTESLDPHTWMSPQNLVVMARNVTRALCEKDTMNAPFFKQRLARFEKNMDVLDVQLRKALLHLPSRSFLIYHPALGYMARQYGLQQLAVEHDGKEPSAAYMQQLVNKCRNENVKVVFISKEHSGRAAQRIANELGAKVVNINPLDYDVPAQMKMIAKSLK